MPPRSPGCIWPPITHHRSIRPPSNPRFAAGCAPRSSCCRMAEMKDCLPHAGLLKNRVILVTGASRGIGRVAALTFAAHGATVVLHGRDVAALEKVYDEIETNGYPQPAAIPLDLEKAATRDYDALAYAIESHLARLDGILHNASHVERLSPLEQQSAEEWIRT